MTTERVPKGLGPGGRRIWRDVLAEYELTGAECEILRQAARTVDELDALEAALASADVTTTGSRGQPVANPLLAQVRDHRATLARLIAALQLPDEPSASIPASSARASDAARRRWNLERHRRAQRGTAS